MLFEFLREQRLLLPCQPNLGKNKPELQLASCLIYARALLEYVMFTTWLRSVFKMLPSVKFAEDKVLTFLILREKCLIVQLRV